LINNEESKLFIQQVANGLSATPVHPMLTKGITDAYISGLGRQHKMTGASILTITSETDIRPSIISVSAKNLMKQPDYFAEIFGPY
jgi:hypothetical protein